MRGALCKNTMVAPMDCDSFYFFGEGLLIPKIYCKEAPKFYSRMCGVGTHGRRVILRFADTNCNSDFYLIATKSMAVHVMFQSKEDLSMTPREGYLLNPKNFLDIFFCFHSILDREERPIVALCSKLHIGAHSTFGTI